MCKLIWAFAVHICPKTWFRMARLICFALQRFHCFACMYVIAIFSSWFVPRESFENVLFYWIVVTSVACVKTHNHNCYCLICICGAWLSLKNKCKMSRMLGPYFLVWVIIVLILNPYGPAVCATLGILIKKPSIIDTYWVIEFNFQVLTCFILLMHVYTSILKKWLIFFFLLKRSNLTK